MNAALVLALVAAAGAAPRLSATVDVASDSSCPSADMVRAALDALDSPAAARRAMVTVRGRDDGLRLEFAWQGLAPTDVRDVQAPRDCGARADAAAVVVASWLGVLPAAPAAAPAVVPAPPPTISGGGAAPALAADARRWWLGIGLGAGGGGDGVVAGGRVELARARHGGRGLGWIASLQGALPRSRTVGAGTSRWVRPALGLAAAFGWRLGSLVIVADVGPLAGGTFAWGSGYPNNQTDQALVFGVCAGLRLQLGEGQSRPWLEVRIVDWPLTQRLRFDSVGGDPITATLPALEGFLTLGWSLPVP